MNSVKLNTQIGSISKTGIEPKSSLLLISQSQLSTRETHKTSFDFNVIKTPAKRTQTLNVKEKSLELVCNHHDDENMESISELKEENNKMKKFKSINLKKTKEKSSSKANKSSISSSSTIDNYDEVKKDLKLRNNYESRNETSTPIIVEAYPISENLHEVLYGNQFIKSKPPIISNKNKSSNKKKRATTGKKSVKKSVAVDRKKCLAKKSIENVENIVLNTISDEQFDEDQNNVHIKVNHKKFGEDKSLRYLESKDYKEMKSVDADILLEKTWFLENEEDQILCLDESKIAYNINLDDGLSSNLPSPTFSGSLPDSVKDSSNTKDTDFDNKDAIHQDSKPSSHLLVQSICTTAISELDLKSCENVKKGPLLGKGAFGKVWQGMTNQGHLIAVKQVDLPLTDYKEALQEYKRLQREVNILKDMRHENIVSFIGTTLEKNTVKIFMEFLSGGSIHSILKLYGPLSEDVFKRYTKQILEGVKYIHSKNVVHRDINGNNIMLLPSGLIKLIDFGCAKRLKQIVETSYRSSVDKRSTKLNTFAGTPYWMAPEVISQSEYGSESDIWSVGCTVFEMATGNPPLVDLDPIAAIFHIGSGKPLPPMPNDISSTARDFIQSCLKHDRNERPSSSSLLQHLFLKQTVKLSQSEC